MATAARATRRPPGRPRKFEQGRRYATVRFTPERYEALSKAAETAGRSISEQVEYTIEQHANYQRVLGRLDDADHRITEMIRGKTENVLRDLGWITIPDPRYGGPIWIAAGRHNVPAPHWVAPDDTTPPAPPKITPDPEFIRAFTQQIAEAIAAALPAELKKQGRRS